MNRHAVIVAIGLTLTAASAKAADPPLAAPSGFQGAGLGMDEQRGRVWGEIAFHTKDFITVFSPTFGFGYRVLDQLEIEAMLPLAYGSVKTVVCAGPCMASRDSGFGIGNPYVGVNWVGLDGTVRYKVGVGMALPLASDSGAEGLAVLYTATTFGFQDLKLWFPDTFAVSGPARVEFGDELIGSLDGELAVLFDAGKLRSGTDAYLTVAPGVGYYFDKTFLLGVRLPLWWGFTDKGDNAQVALEPYLRGDLGQGFLNARFTMNLDEPLGFAFNRGKVWGLHFGGGFVF